MPLPEGHVTPSSSLPPLIGLNTVAAMSSGDSPDRVLGSKLQNVLKALSAQCYQRRWILGGLFVYLGLALGLTWPVMLAPMSQLPLGSEPIATIALSNVWIMWWNADQLIPGFGGYWNAPIYFPSPGALAMNEPQPTTLLVAPVIWLTGSRILAYNVFLWLSLVLNGVFAQRLAKVYGMGPWMGLWLGTAMVLLPIVHWQLGVSHLVPLWGILWTWSAIERLCRQPSRWRGLELGVAVGISFVTSIHQGLFFALLLVGAAPTLWRQWTNRRELPHWVLAVFVALLVAGPFAYKLRQISQEHAVELERELVVDLSATPGDYLQAYGGQLIDISPEKESWKMLSSGWIKFLLALVGVYYGLTRVDTRRWTSFLFVTALLAFLLSLGPNLRVGAWQPWWWLTEHVPGFVKVRSVLRFAFFVQMGVVIFAALGVTILYQACRDRVKSPRLQATLQWGLVLLALTALFEVYPKRGAHATVTDVNQHKVWVEYVREHTPSGYGIACLPLPPTGRVEDYLETCEWMYLGSFHGVPLVNGFSTHSPEEYRTLQGKILAGFPTTEILRKLYKDKVKFIVIRRSSNNPKGAPPRDAILGRYWLKRVCEDELAEVYELGRSRR
jgi:hypothetical protein